MFRRKKKDEAAEVAPQTEAAAETVSSEAMPAVEPPSDYSGNVDTAAVEVAPPAVPSSEPIAESPAASSPGVIGRGGHRVQKVGIVSSDKMQKTVVVRVDRLVLHRKYRRYVRRTSKFMAHDELGSSTGDRVRIIETRPLSARKRWRVAEILQKAAK